MDKHEARTTHFHKESALEKSCLEVFGVAILPFIQTSYPVVVRRTVSIEAVADFGPNANKKNGKSVEH